jgi:hypothetical protein
MGSRRELLASSFRQRTAWVLGNLQCSGMGTSAAAGHTNVRYSWRELSIHSHLRGQEFCE